MFQFKESDTRIFPYSRGEKNPDGTYKTIYADPAQIKRQLDVSLPDRNQLIDQVVAGEGAKAQKARSVAAYERDPVAYMTSLVTSNHHYQPQIPDPADPGSGKLVPNPESALDFAARNGVVPPLEFTGEEMAAIRMGGIADQKLMNGLRAAFGLLDFDEQTGAGCTDYMAIAVYNFWHEWLEKKSGSTPETPTSSSPSPEASTPPS